VGKAREKNQPREKKEKSKKKKKAKKRKNQKKGFGAGTKHYLYTAATGYPLVVLANGNATTWPRKHFSQNPVPKAIPRIAVGYRYYPG
jgi:hypothetical protein